MLIKEADSRARDIAELKKLLLNYRLTPTQKRLIKKELFLIYQGELGEKQARYYIDFCYQNSKNWVVIHDLRIEHGGFFAQIDHILINRLFEIYVLESKYFKCDIIKISENGEFSVKYGNKWLGIPSPLEQNYRHILLLEKFINEKDILPKKLGLTVKPKFWNYVLVSPNTIIKRPSKTKFDNIIKADMLKKAIEESAEKIGLLELARIANLSSLDTVIDFAQKLVSFHQPLKIDWKKKFKISERNKKLFCAKCQKAVSKKEALYCLKHKKRFKGKIFCFYCQRQECS